MLARLRIAVLAAICACAAVLFTMASANAKPAIEKAAIQNAGAEKAEVELRRITQELLDAIAPGHAEVWDRYLDKDLIHLDENGIVRNKAEFLKELKPLPAGLVGRSTIDYFKVTLHGNVAIVVHEDQEYLDYFGQIIRDRFRNTDTWLKTGAGWRLLSEHTTAVVKDPPVVTLPHDRLCAYEGSYELPNSTTGAMHCKDDGLVFERPNRPAVHYVAELHDVFFVKGQPRTRRIFLRDANDKLIGFADRREGADVRWVKTQ